MCCVEIIVNRSMNSVSNSKHEKIGCCKRRNMQNFRKIQDSRNFFELRDVYALGTEQQLTRSLLERFENESAKRQINSFKKKWEEESRLIHASFTLIRQ